MSPSGRRCAVLGRPIAHSLSPALHRAAYAALGLDDWTYDRYEIDEHQLTGFVDGCDGSWRGLSLTMPLKVAALALGEVDPVAALVGAANTLVFAARAPAVFDAIYDPWPTPLASAAERAGCTVVNGLDLLVGQAVLQIELMTGARVDPALLLAAGRAELARNLTLDHENGP